MAIRFVRNQLKKMKEHMQGESIDAERKAQELVGTLLQKTQRTKLLDSPVELLCCRAAVLQPEEPQCSGAVLYLHGGGYCCGDLEYAKGFGSILAAQAGVEVLCPAYRLAPEFPYPAALEDAVEAYKLLLAAHSHKSIVLVGESAGGGLCYSLCLQLRQEGLPMPAGIIAMSPWTDLTQSGASYESNCEADPSMTRAHLQRFADAYTDCPKDPLVSPLFGTLDSMPESLLFVGGDEVMLDDTLRLHEKLLAAGCRSTLTVAPELWHAYVLYCLKERRTDMEAIIGFIRRFTL